MSFEQFPKQRNELPEEYKKIYDSWYKINRYGQSKSTGMSMKLERWLHRQVARDTIDNDNLRTLEIGAGTLNQLEYEKTKKYDIVEPYRELYETSQYRSRVSKIYTDIREIPNSEKYDRITAVACFEHICNLPEVVCKAKQLLAPDGVLRVAIPNQGRFLWTFAYRMTTGREFRKKYNLNYDVLMNYEHVNTADEIEDVLRYYFNNVKMKLLGVNKTFAFYRYYECKL